MSHNRRALVFDRESIRDGLFGDLGKEAERLGLMRPHTDSERVESRRAMLAELPPGEDVWVFGYGSLMWNPAIHFAERRAALLRGWHRSFCLWTPIGRGSPENPGLVLGLDFGGSCRGIAYRIARDAVDEELDLLWRREMVADGYNPRWVQLNSSEGRVRAITWTINRHGQRYAGKLAPDVLARHLATATGRLGANRDYLEATVAHLDELGIREGPLHSLLQQVRAYCEERR